MDLRIFTRLAASTLAISCARLVSQSKPCPAIDANISDAKFKPGQVWSYLTRQRESDSTLTILEVDRSAMVGIIVHIRVDGLQAHNPKGEIVPSIEHMPFSRDAMLWTRSSRPCSRRAMQDSRPCSQPAMQNTPQ